MLLLIAILLIVLTLVFAEKLGNSWASYGTGFLIAIAVLITVAELLANEAAMTIVGVLVFVFVIGSVVWACFFNNSSSKEKANSKTNAMSQSTSNGRATSNKGAGSETCPNASDDSEKQGEDDFALQAAGIYTIGMIVSFVLFIDEMPVISLIFIVIAIGYYIVRKVLAKRS